MIQLLPILKRFIAGLTLMLCCLPLSAVNANDLADSAQQNLSAHLEEMTSLVGLFVQKQYDSEGELLQSSSGDFAMARPGKLSWNTLEPYPQSLISDGETLWLYDPDLEQVSVQTIGDNLKQTPAVIISGDLAQIKADFDVVLTQANGDVESFDLRPKHTSEYFQRLTLVFTKGRLTGMRLLDGFGQDTQFELSDLSYNQVLAKQRFSFTAPAGTDVLINE